MRLALLGMMLVGACGSNASETDAPSAGARRCEMLEGIQFASLEQRECGLGPNGPELCTWHITFSARDASTSEFDWSHSDVGESGFVTCDGTAVEDPMSHAQRGTYDPAKRQLVWEDVTYAAP